MLVNVVVVAVGVVGDETRQHRVGAAGAEGGTERRRENRRCACRCRRHRRDRRACGAAGALLADAVAGRVAADASRCRSQSGRPAGDADAVDREREHGVGGGGRGEGREDGGRLGERGRDVLRTGDDSMLVRASTSRPKRFVAARGREGGGREDLGGGGVVVGVVWWWVGGCWWLVPRLDGVLATRSSLFPAAIASCSLSICSRTPGCSATTDRGAGSSCRVPAPSGSRRRAARLRRVEVARRRRTRRRRSGRWRPCVGARRRRHRRVRAS